LKRGYKYAQNIFEKRKKRLMDEYKQLLKEKHKK
jgi:hypothetical protein